MLEKKEKYKVYKSSVVIAVFNMILFYGMYAFVLIKYINFLEKIQEPILVFIGLIIFMYLSLGRVFSYLGETASTIKYNFTYEEKKNGK